MSATKTAKRDASKRPDFIDPSHEAQAVKALRESIAALNQDDELLADTIEGETGFFEVIDKLLDRILEADAMAEGVAVVAAKLAERKARAETNAKRDRALIEQAMTIAGLDRITRPGATFTIAQRPPSLVVTEESEIPPRFWKPGEPKLDRKALADALRDGGSPIPGAMLSNGAPSLTIRIK